MTRLRAAATGSRCAAFALFALVAAAVHAQDRFVVSSDGQEVTDSTTKLVWRRCGEGQGWDGKTCSGKLAKYKYAGARQATEAAAKGSGKPWRIPSREELVWAIRAGSDDDLNAWLVNFRNGRVSGYAGQTTFPLRLVRTP